MVVGWRGSSISSTTRENSFLRGYPEKHNRGFTPIYPPRIFTDRSCAGTRTRWQPNRRESAAVPIGVNLRYGCFSLIL